MAMRQEESEFISATLHLGEIYMELNKPQSEKVLPLHEFLWSEGM